MATPIQPYQRTIARKHGAPGRDTRPSSTTVDLHSHILVPEAQKMVAENADLSKITGPRFSSELSAEVGKRQMADRRPYMTEVDKRLFDMDEMGVDIQVVIPSPNLCYPGIEPELAQRVHPLINDKMAEFAARQPDRFIPLGALPVQDTELAIAEMTRAVSELGLRGFQLLTWLNGEEISTLRLDPFWAKVEELETLIFLHPAGFPQGERFAEHYFNNLIGNPLDTTVALHRLIFDGVLERYPKLKILAAHGGGYLPAYSGRIDHAWGAREDCRQQISNPPSTYLQKIHFDTVVFTPEQLAYLVQMFGAEKIVMGTDYPFDMAEYDPIGHLNSADDLQPSDIESIAGKNAMRLLGLD